MRWFLNLSTSMRPFTPTANVCAVKMDKYVLCVNFFGQEVNPGPPTNQKSMTSHKKVLSLENVEPVEGAVPLTDVLKKALVWFTAVTKASW